MVASRSMEQALERFGIVQGWFDLTDKVKTDSKDFLNPGAASQRLLPLGLGGRPDTLARQPVGG